MRNFSGNFVTRYDWFNGDFVNVTYGSQHGNEAAKLKTPQIYTDDRQTWLQCCRAGRLAKGTKTLS